MRFWIIAIWTGLVLGRPTVRGSRLINPAPGLQAELEDTSYAATARTSLISDHHPRTSQTQVTCNVLVKQDSTTLGYVSPVWNRYGEYGTFQASSSGALQVQFSYDDSSQNRLDLTAINGPSNTFPMFGGIVGYSSGDDLGPGSFDYIYLGGTASTPVGSPPVNGPNSFDAQKDYNRKIESAIWKYTPSTGQLIPQWVNTNSAMFPNYVLYGAGDKVLVVTGDKAVFQSKVPAGAYPEVVGNLLDQVVIVILTGWRQTLTCVP
ncbi:hypothetical protein CTheo_6375 [Ceratobasidium theobromae]|uniref:Uncharacterized protein n=1 Tax=Ceratobasidium theobromae TaxID=1582974 RepID=A0A5N5QEK1_9AGAM|nr:hypothetical protein CTheo_6375 [Ceratobasidium theobromae]